MFELIPYVRETFRRHLSLKQAVMLVEFDKLKRVRDISSLRPRGNNDQDLGLPGAPERNPFQADRDHGR